MVIDNKPIETHKKPKRTKEELQQVLNNRKGALMDHHGLWKKGRTYLTLRKDQNKKGN
jgi:hypothetical protein